MGSRTARGLAAAALIFSVTVTTFAGSANAAPLAESDCSVAAHARNDAVHLLHTAWKVFSGDLKDLASDARKLQHESRKDKASAVLMTDARAEVASAKQELKSISSKAHADIQAEVELGSACKDEEDTTTTTTTTTSTSTTAPSDATVPADSTGSAHTFDTSGLDEKYKDIVEDAIADMQAVVDEAGAAVMDMAAAAETKETTDDSEVKTDLKTAKADREKAKEDREQAKIEAKDKSSKDKSSNSGKGNGKSKGRN
ncbi:MAG: hypothetical protein AABM32_13725 [Chloroflexota bacterium]